MNVDRGGHWELLTHVKPAAVVSYLAAGGWRRSYQLGRGEVWALDDLADATDPYTALVALDSSVGDYGARVADLVDTLAEIEGRSPEAIFEDLTATGWDTRSVRLFPDSPSGTIPLLDAARAHDAAKDLVQAAAIAELYLNPMAVQPSQKPLEARNFLRQSQLCPSRSGSYILTVRTPISPSRAQGHEPVQLEFNVEPGIAENDAPFGRRVSQRLYTATAAALSACGQAAAPSGSATEFGDYLSLGVSSNILDALAGFSGETKEGKFELRFGWGADVSHSQETPPIRFPAGAGVILAEGAKYLRSLLEYETATLRGAVVKTHRELKQGPGYITVYGTFDADVSGRLRRVRVHLPQEFYSTAVNAHDQGLDVRVTGRLSTRGTMLHFDEVTDLAVLPMSI